MANYSPSKDPDPIVFDKFFGLNEGTGELQLKIGEATVLENFRITDNMRVQKRRGYKTLVDYNNSLPVYIWAGELNNKEVIISTNNGNVYEYNVVSEVNVQIGTLSDTNQVSFFYFKDKLYFLNGSDYKEYDGTTFQDVEPYIPIVSLQSNPDGSNYTQFEELNILTGSKRQEFTADGVAKDFILLENILDSIDSVYVDGVLQVEGTDYTTDTTLGKVTFVGTPINEATVLIGWTKTSTSNPEYIKNCRYAMDFGPGNDTTIFMWGNPNFKNRRFNSRYLDPSYFPSNEWTDIGSYEHAITDIISVYSRQLVFTEEKTYFSLADRIQYIDGDYEYEYPIYDLNENKGNTPFNQVHLVENAPVSFYEGGMWLWKNTQTEDERNVEYISEKVSTTLRGFDFSDLVTYDYTKRRELWISQGDNVLIWNYGNNTFYKYTNINAHDIKEFRGELYFTTLGTIEHFDEQQITDNGTAIVSRFETGFHDFGVNHLRKSTRRVWVTIKPEGKAGFKFGWQTNRKSSDLEDVSISYILFDYNSIDYSEWTYQTNINPQPYRFKLRAKKYAYIKFIFVNDKIDETLTLLNFKAKAITTGEVK